MNDNLRASNLQINLQEICRTCLMDKNDLREIVCFIPLLQKCTSIQIDLEDELPKLICFECMTKLNKAIEFWRQCEVSEKILLQLRQFQENSIFYKEKEAYSSPHNEVNTIKVNQIKTESSHHENEDIPNTCEEKKLFISENNLYTYDENNTFKINNVFNIVNTKLNIASGSSERYETIINENKNNLDISKLRNVDLKSKYNTQNKIDDDNDFNDQSLSEIFIKEEPKHSDFENCESVSQNSAEYLDLRKKKPFRKTNRSNRKLKHKNKLETKKYVDTINNEQNGKFELKKIKIEEAIDDKQLEVKVDDTANIETQCPQCGKSFELNEDLEIHKLQHKKFDDLICPKCPKSFGNERNLKRHLIMHMVNKPYKCDFCEKGFAGSGDRIRHLRTHTGERPYICQTCGKPFPDSSGLSQHMKFHNSIKSYICSVCSKGFVFPYELRRHMRMHTGEKPFLCSLCGKGFRDSTDLKIHTRNHTGERPFACSECDRTFKIKKHLNLHMRTHTGYKPHVCKLCEAGFARKENLTRHNRIHTVYFRRETLCLRHL
ncbi:zinc finger protein 432-like isoform X2 [Chrysoperla carnea]|uniref:zinc finger protein 432-like isoform X2 n=1 Tax=Chrysoperla carnea TaxID=189513 RepID=UPI001D06889C|nr:zinc finger protein 432-like isoform X2 [Chrysoperla carnea]